MAELQTSSEKDNPRLEGPGAPIAEQLQTLRVTSAPATCSEDHDEPKDEKGAQRYLLEGCSAEGPATSPPTLSEGATPVPVHVAGGEARCPVPGFDPLECPVAYSSPRDAALGGEPHAVSRPEERGEPDPWPKEKPPPNPGDGEEGDRVCCPVEVKGDPKNGWSNFAEGDGGLPEPLDNEDSSMQEKISSSSSESDSDSESDTSTDSSSSCLPILSEDDDLECSSKNNSASVRKKGELSEDPLLVEDLNIILPQSVELMPFGKVSAIVDHLVIIESQKGLPPVNENTVLFCEDRRSIGKVFEVFGPVWHPYYVVQFNSPEHIASKGVKDSDAVYFAPSVESFTQYIFPEKLKQEKGSDASWKNDEEPPPEALDFSDDEKEKAAKQQKKSQNARRKKLKSQQDDSNENGLQCQPRRQNPLDYSNRYCKGGSNPRFTRGTFPHSSAPPHFFGQKAKPLQYYSKYSQQQKPPAFSYPQNQEPSRREQCCFQPPFETARNDAGFPPPCPPVNWGWPHGYTQNPYDPLLSLLSMPPPPPPPLPPPSTQLNNTNYS